MGDDKRLSALGHFSELRGRLIRSIIVVVITATISFIFAKQIFAILILPITPLLVDGDANLIYIGMTEMVGTYMKVSLAGGIILAMPFLVYQLIMFISPALTRKEKRHVFLILPWIALMFLGGVVFGYFILVPPATQFLLTWGSDIAAPQIKIDSYISVVTRLLLAIGIAFEMPVVTTFLSRIGVVTPKWMASKRKVAIIFAFILAAIITPTFDPINQSLVAIPIIVLYEMGIWLAKLVQRKVPKVVESVIDPASQD